MSKSPDTETVNQDPWDVAIPYMQGGFKESAKLYNEHTAPNPYGDDDFATPNDKQM